MVNTHIIGQKAEDIATEYLTKKKIKIIDRNYRTSFGEIDIIAKDKKEYIFVEVKAKRGSGFGKPYEMVTNKKKQKLIRTAKGYLNDLGLDDINWRIDIISIDYKKGEIEWIKNAVLDE